MGIEQTSVAALQQRLTQPGEYALVDVSEAGQFGTGHLLQASNLPYSRLELDIGTRVPRHSCEIWLLDQGDGVAERAAERLQALGYDNLRLPAGGTPAWQAAGYPLFQGVYVPSKAFGEMLEHELDTPAIQVEHLQTLFDNNADVQVIDPRTPEEHEVQHIPHSVNCPGAELLWRFEDLVPSPDTLVVVACGGRTRAIVGAQALINAQVPNRVVALEGGNLAWRLSQRNLEHGTRQLLAERPTQTRLARERALALAARHGIETIDTAQLQTWRADPARSTYLLDVRSTGEYLAGHLPGAISSPGGQLVQALDTWVATWGARLVLTDDDGVRAIQTAHLLQQMGWEVHVLSTELPLPAHQPEVLTNDNTLDPQTAALHLQQGALALHLGNSADYLRRHPVGSHWLSRARLPQARALLGQARQILLFAEDPAQAALARDEIAALSGADVQVMRDGVPGWAAAGLPLSRDGHLDDNARIDHLQWLHERKADNLQHMRAYLDWEAQLPAQLQAVGYTRLRIGKPS